jgi:NADH dehydrogenase [ubiquinone] 1 alpha subcomplex assembly factor 1
MKTSTIYNFTAQSNPQDWIIIDDVVMGGRSNGNFTISDDGHGIFSGAVSLENNGGFSSVRHQFTKLNTIEDSKVVIRLKGDGKDYQFRIKDKKNAYYSYITTFKTNGEWQNVTIHVKDLYPSYRGRTLDLPNFAGGPMEEIVFLIGNKKNESFQLVIDKIELE